LEIDIHPFLRLQHALRFAQAQRSRDVDAFIELLLEFFSFHKVPPLLCVLSNAKVKPQRACVLLLLDEPLNCVPLPDEAQR